MSGAHSEGVAKTSPGEHCTWLPGDHGYFGDGNDVEIGVRTTPGEFLLEASLPVSTRRLSSKYKSIADNASHSLLSIAKTAFTLHWTLWILFCIVLKWLNDKQTDESHLFISISILEYTKMLELTGKKVMCLSGGLIKIGLRTSLCLCKILQYCCAGVDLAVERVHFSLYTYGGRERLYIHVTCSDRTF